MNGIPIKETGKIREIVGYLPQDFSFYRSMSVYDAMDYLGLLSNIPDKIRRERILALLEQVNLKENMRTKGKALSGGMKRRLGIAQALLSEYENNSYATYPLGYYKAITLNDDKQKRVLEILCEITGLTEEQLKDLPEDYFSAITGSIISFNAMSVDENGSLSTEMGSMADTESEDDKYEHFISQVTYEHFKELMQEMENIIGEKGSQYSTEMMITYFGMSEMTYEEACEEYHQIINQDKVTGGFARLFCDYMGLVLGLYPIFLVVTIWLKDGGGNAAEVIYSRKISSVRLVVLRYLASITMILIPVLLLSFESLIPLISFGAENAIQVDSFAYLKYIYGGFSRKSWWYAQSEYFLLCLQTRRLLLPFNFFGGW